MLLEKAKSVAATIMRKLQPHCARIYIAGSIRREKPDVGDIEIVCTPKKTVVGGNTLFEDVPVEYEVDRHFIREVENLGVKIKGSPQGRYCQIRIDSNYGDINCDIFIPQEHDFYRQYVIRTGSREFVHNVIALAWRRAGWVGTEDGLRRFDECININEGKLGRDNVRLKPVYVCTKEHPQLPPSIFSEEQFFDWLGLDFVQPKERKFSPYAGHE